MTVLFLDEDEQEQLRKAATERVTKLKRDPGSGRDSIDTLAALCSALRKLGGACW